MRKTGHPQLKEVCNLLEESSSKLNVNTWKCFEIDFSVPFSKRKDVFRTVQNNIGTTVGLYAIFDGETCLYIGKGKLVAQRIKSHYKASQGEIKHPRWVEFFEQYSKKLIIYWTEYGGLSSDSLDDKLRHVIEVILQEEYEPLFEKFSIEYKQRKRQTKQT